MATTLGQRRLTAELMDHLPPGDIGAIRSRRDLMRINALMFNAAITAERLRRDLPEPPRRIVELGCGDGSFMLRVARQLAPRWPGVEVVLLDRQDLVSAETRYALAELGWAAETLSADAEEWLVLERPGFDLVTANLFFHHFDDDGLRRLLSRVHRLAPALIATEPRRSRLALLATGLLGFIGANAVTRHDAPASVRAGFTGTELGKLWPAPERTREYAAGPFTHVFSARR